MNKVTQLELRVHNLEVALGFIVATIHETLPPYHSNQILEIVDRLYDAAEPLGGCKTTDLISVDRQPVGMLENELFGDVEIIDKEVK